jgi:hypothetical protein
MCCWAATGHVWDPRRCSSPVKLRRVAEGDGAGKQRAARPLPAARGTPGDALHPLNCAGLQKGMVLVNNVLLGRYWPRVGPLETLFTCILCRVEEGDGGGEQRAAGPLLAADGTPGDALHLLNCAGWQKGMVVVNNVLLGRYWPRVGPQETLFTC